MQYIVALRFLRLRVRGWSLGLLDHFGPLVFCLRGHGVRLALAEPQKVRDRVRLV